MPKIQFVEQVLPVELLAPATDAAGRTSGYLKLANAQRATVIFHVTQGSASTILISVLQATDEEGAGSKVITVAVPIWVNDDITASDDCVRQTDAVNYTTSAGTTHKIVVIQLDPEYFDITHGFNSFAISTGASSASNLTSALALIEQRYAQPLVSANYSDVV